MHFLYSLDVGLLQYLYSIRTTPLTYFFIDVSELGRSEIVLGITVAAALFFILWKRYADIAGLFVSALGSSAVLLILKYAVHRPRPEWWYQAYSEGPNYSFPSAHAGLSMALYGFLMYLLLQSAPTQFRRFCIACLPVLILLVGLSRLFLGVHYFSDVIAGFLVGAIFVYVGIQVRLHFLKR